MALDTKESTMYCAQCGTALSTSNKFCSKCGTEVSQPDRSTTPKRNRAYLFDVIPGAAAAQLCKSLALSTGFHGSPTETAFVAGISAALGFIVGFALSLFIRTRVTKSRSPVFFLSLMISIGLSLPFFFVTTFLNSNSATQSQSQNTVAQDWDSVGTPVYQNTVTELPSSAVAEISSTNGTPTDQGFVLTLSNNNPDWTVTELHLMVFETVGRPGTLMQALPSEGLEANDVAFKNITFPYGKLKASFSADTNKAYGFVLMSDMKGFQR